MFTTWSRARQGRPEKGPGSSTGLNRRCSMISAAAARKFRCMSENRLGAPKYRDIDGKDVKFCDLSRLPDCDRGQRCECNQIPFAMPQCYGMSLSARSVPQLPIWLGNGYLLP